MGMSAMSTIAVILAAGHSERMGGAVPKQYRLLGGMPVLRHSLLGIIEANACDKILIVIRPGHELFYRQSIEGLPSTLLLEPSPGGKTRQDSVYAALQALAPYQPKNILIHDAARPFLNAALIRNTLAALENAPGAICACAVADTLKRAVGDQIAETVDRNALYAAQTPQAFDFSILSAAHKAARKQGRADFTDDAALLEWQGHKVMLVPSSIDNFKLTTAEDWKRAEKQFVATSRSALGYDVHAFDEGDHVMLGGIRIAHTYGVQAHSDGDVILHALTDALLGLAGAGDIGQHFPPSDPQWKNADSRIFVSKALEILRDRSGKIAHCDITLIAQEPKISSYREKIIASLALILALPVQSIGLKATTSEGLGFIGRNEGLAAYAMVTAQF